MGGEEQALLYTLEEISGSDYCLREDPQGGAQVRVFCCSAAFFPSLPWPLVQKGSRSPPRAFFGGVPRLIDCLVAFLALQGGVEGGSRRK